MLDREDGAGDSDDLDVPLAPALALALQPDLRVVARDALRRFPVPFTDGAVGWRAERDGDDHRVGLLLRGSLLEFGQRLLDLIQLLRGLRTPAPEELHRTRNRNSECFGRVSPRVRRLHAHSGAEAFDKPPSFPAIPAGDDTDVIRQLEAVGGMRPLAVLGIVRAAHDDYTRNVLIAEDDDLVPPHEDEKWIPPT